MAAWEPIKLMSGDPGGAFNVNSAHPFENPTPASSLIEIVAMLLIPLAFVRTFGVMIGSKNARLNTIRRRRRSHRGH